MLTDDDDGEEFIERLDIPPAIQGLWRIAAVYRRNGEGFDITRADGQPFCRVFATKLRTADGNELIVDRILEGKSAQNEPQWIVRFINEKIWVMSRVKPNMVLVDTELDDSTPIPRPVTRLLFMVER